MKSKLLASLLLLTVGCAAVRTTTVVKHEVSLEEINKVCFRSPHGQRPNNFGCAYFSAGQPCTIYLPKKSEYAEMRRINPKIAHLDDLTIELYLLGHETKHCFDGHWH